tara:strand:+ start:7807 stop:8007 length:201 start_codon:yes stop_codon:yes gene_type:complete
MRIKDLTVFIMGAGLICLLGFIVYDEFALAREQGGPVDQNIIELLQMSLTGVIGIVAGHISGRESK